MKKLLTIVAPFLLSAAMSAQSFAPLYPGDIPNSRTGPDTERILDRETGGRAYEAVTKPEIAAYLPDHPNGKAVIICPGGGYSRVVFQKEGSWVAERLVADSITVFVLKYRIPQDATNIDKRLAPLMDAQQAIRMVRGKAAEYNIDPNQIGIMGFSAGGSLAATAATQFHYSADPTERDTTSVRPDFVGLIYPVISMDTSITHGGSRRNLLGEHPSEADVLRFSAEKQVTDDSPPAFLVHAADDRSVPVENSLAYYRSCIEHGVPVEMHLYAGGGHGFGLNNPTTPDDWLERFTNWLQTL